MCNFYASSAIWITWLDTMLGYNGWIRRVLVRPERFIVVPCSQRCRRPTRWTVNTQWAPKIIENPLVI